MEQSDLGVDPTVAAGDGARPTAGRRPLDQMRILQAAVAFIDERGLSRLTMRRLGAHLGVEAMALYRYVPGREQLLDGVVEYVMDELYRDTMLGSPANSWQEFLQQLAHAVRKLALDHPRIFPLVATRPPAAPWLRPPLRSLRWVEAFLRGLTRYGFSAETGVAVYRTFATFLLGSLLLEASTHANEPTISESRDIAFIESNDLEAYPTVVEVAELLKLDGYQQEFEEALEDLIDRVALLRD